jgi:hypothetical protein
VLIGQKRVFCFAICSFESILWKPGQPAARTLLASAFASRTCFMARPMNDVERRYLAVLVRNG